MVLSNNNMILPINMEGNNGRRNVRNNLPRNPARNAILNQNEQIRNLNRIITMLGRNGKKLENLSNEIKKSTVVKNTSIFDKELAVFSITREEPTCAHISGRARIVRRTTMFSISLILALAAGIILALATLYYYFTVTRR